MTTITKLTIYLQVRDAAAAIDFYVKVFGAKEVMRLLDPKGKIGHAELRIGDEVLMLADEYPDYGCFSPQSHGGTGTTIHMAVSDVDELTRTAKDAGATVLMEPADQFYGERSAKIRDPFGHEWLLGKHLEDVSPEELQRRMSDIMAC